jgi:chromosome segregation ATPase
MIFTLGNIITLCIVVLALVLFRVLDKNNRSMSNVRKYADKCKQEIAVYAEEKSMAVKNFGIDLDVEKKAAMQLMKNIQKLTEEELTKKSESISRIEEHIQAFESSLEELTGMTDRVQENLNRIRDESAFVESTGKRVNEAKEKFEQLEKAFSAANKNLEITQERLERKNVETLEQTAAEVITSARAMLSDFEATAQSIENRIEEQRDELAKSEREREAAIAHDMELVKKTLKDVLENAGTLADKMEDAALVKLR